MTKIQRVFERHENGVEEQFYPITHINAVNGLKDYFDANNGVFGVTSVNGQTGVVNINVLTDEERRTLEQLQNGEINFGGNSNNPNTENSFQIQDTGWKDIKLEVGYTFDEYTKPQYRILNGFVALKGEIKGITKEQVNKKIATLDYVASPDKIMFISCLVQNDDIKFAKLQIDGDGNINLLTTQESGNIVLNNVYPIRIEKEI